MRGWEHVTKADLTKRDLARAGKPSKYHNVKALVDGLVFDSKHEAATWQALRLREKAGEIHDLQRQVQFPLYCPDLESTTTGAMRQVAVYVADFVYRDVGTDVRHVLDSKGQRKRICPYPLKKKWMLLQYGIEIEEV